MALTQEDRVLGGQRSAVARRRKMADHADHVEIVETVIDGIEPSQLGTKFLQLASRLADEVNNATITPETALEAKQLMEAAALAHKMGRLEYGESTSNTITFNATDRDAQLADIQRRAAALAAEDSTASPS